MNGSSTGLESADASGPSDAEQQLRDSHEALRLFNATAKAACDQGEWKLQREAEDAAGRIVARITEQQRSLEERQRSGEALHGENPQAA